MRAELDWILHRVFAAVGTQQIAPAAHAVKKTSPSDAEAVAKQALASLRDPQADRQVALAGVRAAQHAELLLRRGNAGQAADALLARALLQPGRHAQVIELAEWLSNSRGRAYAERFSDYIWQPVNVLESTLALEVAAAAEKAVRLTSRTPIVRNGSVAGEGHRCSRPCSGMRNGSNQRSGLKIDRVVYGGLHQQLATQRVPALPAGLPGRHSVTFMHNQMPAPSSPIEPALDLDPMREGVIAISGFGPRSQTRSTLELDELTPVPASSACGPGRPASTPAVTR